MIRQYRFSELMARLTNEEWTVIQDDRGNFPVYADCLQRPEVVMAWLLILVLAANAAVPYAAYKFSVKRQEGVWKA